MDDEMIHRFALTDAQWGLMKDWLPGRRGTVGVNAKDNRLFVNAVLYHFRTGCPWRDLPREFGGWKNAHRRFSRWAARGVWKGLFEHLASDGDNRYAMLDGTITRAHRSSAGADKKGD
jgi:transposase